LIGIYLEGSLANGDFDEISDIDFIVVTRDEVSNALFLELQRMHAQLGKGDSPWARDLEGSYVSQTALRRYHPACSIHPNIERGAGELLKMVQHDAAWVIHRHILRERGIVIIGPAPRTLVDPISPTDLRQAAQSTLRRWASGLLADPRWSDSD